MPLFNKFWGSRVNNGNTTEVLLKKLIMTFLLKRNSLKITRDIFFKIKVAVRPKRAHAYLENVFGI